MEFDVSRMTPEDIDGVAELDRQCFKIPWSRKAFADELANEMTYYLKAKYNDEYIGYAGLWNIAGEGHITNIAVLEKYRNKGIATAMLNEMINYVKENSLTLLTLEVRKSNCPAIKLYKKFGFKILGERKHFYSDNREDAFIMTMDFPCKERMKI